MYFEVRIRMVINNELEKQNKLKLGKKKKYITT